MALKTVNPGDLVRAEDFNAVVEELRRLRSIAQAPETGVVKSLLQGLRADTLVPCRIVAVSPASAQTTPTAMGMITYDIVGRRRAGINMLGKVPYYGRPAKDPTHMIYAARVGDDCWLVRTPDDEAPGEFQDRVIVLSEYRAVRICGT